MSVQLRIIRQKLNRFFAPELLMPASALEEAIASEGPAENVIEALSQAYGVSDGMVRFALVNKGHAAQDEVLAAWPTVRMRHPDATSTRALQ